MLTKAENPALFTYVAVAASMVDKTINPILCTTLSDEQLAKVTSLEISATSLDNIASLKGIEKLPNLTTFSLNGNDPLKYQLKYFSALERARFAPDYDLEKDLKFFRAETNACQINNEDLKYLYQCKKLASLNLDMQRNITDIDLSNFKGLRKLSMQNATGLKSVKGLDQLDAIKGKNQDGKVDYYDTRYDFSGCTSLKEIENFTSVIDSVCANSSGDVESHLFLPTVTYASLYTGAKAKNTQFEGLLKDEKFTDFIRWTDVDQGGVRFEHNSGQMSMATHRVEDIIRTVNQDDPKNDIGRLSGWYRWIADNVTYDNDGLDYSNSSGLSAKRYKNVLRSSFETLWRKKGVCTGIRNLFNFGATLMGYTALPVNCRAENSADVKHSGMVVNDHALSLMFVNDKPYFLDPTWDLGQQKSNYFLLTKEEIENKRHQFGFDQEHLGGKSQTIQGAIEPYLKTRSQQTMGR